MIKMIVYADNAATTKMCREAIDASLPYMDKVYGNPGSLHTFGQEASRALYGARESIALNIGCEPKEIYFTSGGSEADNQAIISTAKLGEKQNKRHIVSSAFEHHAVLHTLDKLKKQGFEITLLPVHENGIIQASELGAAIREDTCLVTIMYANNEIGTVQPVAEIGELCRCKGVLFHTDAVQAAGHLKIDAAAQNIDMLSLSAHKFHGPKGVGVLYAKKGISLTSLLEGGAQERGKRAGTENIPGVIGMAVALDKACKNIDVNTKRLTELRDKIIEGILKIPHCILNGDRFNRLPGNINICFEGIEGEGLLLLLDRQGIMASSGSACTSGSLEPSHVLLALGRPHEIAHGSLRLSLSKYNTEDEADYIIAKVTEVVEYLREMSPVWKDLQEGKREYIIK